MTDTDAASPAPDTSAPDTAPAPGGNALSDGKVLEELSRPENPTDYIAERRDEEAADALDNPPPGLDKHRAKSRYARLRSARDSLQTENAELRQRLGMSPERQAPGKPQANEQPPPESGPLQEAVQQGREEFEAADARNQMWDQAREVGAFQAKAAEFQRTVAPDFGEIVPLAFDSAELPRETISLIRTSPHGARIAYALAKEAFEGTDQILYRMAHMSAPEAARFIGHLEAKIDAASQAPQQQRRVTNAPAPLRPVGGGSSGPSRDLSSLAQKDDVADYIRARRQQRGDD